MSMRTLSFAAVRRLSVVTTAIAIAACAEKAVMPPFAGSPRFTIQVSATTPQTSANQKLFVVAAYFSSVPTPEDSVRILDTATVAITGGPQQVTLKVDLAACLADQARRGSRDACTMYVAAMLQPATFNAETGDLFGNAYDYQVLGPFDAIPGRPPVVPAIDLSTSRFVVHHWEADEALRVGGDLSPLYLDGPITGLPGSGSSAATLYAVTSGVNIQYPSGSGSPLIQPVAQLAIFQNGTWRRVSGPTNVTFNDVAAFSATDVYIAGSDGLYRYDGTSITPVSAVREPLRSIAVTGPNASTRYLAAGTNAGNVWIGNLTTYTRYSTNSGQVIDGVCINAANEAFAASRGGGGLFRFDGTTFTSVPASGFPQSKSDLQCLGPGQAYVAPLGSNVLLRWAGTGWAQIVGPSAGGRPLSWSVASANEIYAVGDSAVASRGFYRYDGNTWRDLGRLSYTGSIQQRPWADPRGGAAYVASSSYGATRIEAVSSTSARVLSYQPSMRDAIMPSASSAFVVGANFFLARWDGSRWNVDAPPVGTPSLVVLQGVWADAANNAWAVGQQSAIARWDGTRWNVVSDLRRPIAQTMDNYNAAWGAGGSVWIAGDATILRCRTATSCATDIVPGSGPLYGIWGTSATNAFAVGANGRILRFDGNTWTTMASPTRGRLSRVWGSSPTDVWAAGDTVVVHYDGTSWKSATREVHDVSLSGYTEYPQTPFQTAIWGSPSREVYIGTWYGRVMRGHNSFWGEMSGPFQGGIGRIVAIAGATNGCAFAVSDGQTQNGGATLLRGVGPNGCFASSMTPPASWP